jgi:hypothetical protein
LEVGSGESDHSDNVSDRYIGIFRAVVFGLEVQCLEDLGDTTPQQQFLVLLVVVVRIELLEQA